ncbi:uncharacterized protein BJ171DRAFT_502070 [Polychytrium aggregatum]|uniref:uncharacterized protein n=1 Tax=Polychytrium aggregatum TaxID=110093 RepID=UPI0022FE3371|nr:uncharacterized protein BJ171DRAFT_502070 [Polychytrium aggregatum]KAI9205425.1 hypothetical protein BJ171DRAFT_502070 [Polychytrium aggregatum]
MPKSQAQKASNSSLGDGGGGKKPLPPKPATTDSSGEPIDPNKATPEVIFSTMRAEGDLLARQGDFLNATKAYTLALEIRPDDLCSLIARSRCYTLTGEPQLGLEDAEHALRVDPASIRGLYQRAEALYTIGDFETALVHYHRGHMQRPEIVDFEMGIVKACEAIKEAIERIDPTRMKEQRRRMLEQERLASPTLSIIKPADLHAGLPLPPPAGIPKKFRARSAGSSRGSNYGSRIGSARGPKAALAPLDGNSAEVQKNLLEEMYDDKVFFQELAQDECLLRAGKGEIADLINEGLRYFDARIEFWRQRNPAGVHAVTVPNPLRDRFRSRINFARDAQAIAVDRRIMSMSYIGVPKKAPSKQVPSQTR